MVKADPILIFHAGALGDFVLTWPLALALHRLHPDKQIIYVTPGSKGQLAARYLQTGYSDSDTQGWHTLFSDDPRVSPAGQDLLHHAQAIYSFFAQGNELFTANLNQLAPQAGITNLQCLIPAHYTQHITEFYNQQLAASPALAACCREIILELCQRGLIAPASGASQVLLHPGAGSRAKCWPVEHFAQLAEWLRNQGIEVGCLIGEVEEERFSAGQMARLAKSAKLLRPANYLQLADALSRCRLLVTNDNGPGHLAGMLGIPTLSFFGPTDPRVWHPLGPQTHSWRAEPLESLTAGEVAENYFFRKFASSFSPCCVKKLSG